MNHGKESQTNSSGITVYRVVVSKYPTTSRYGRGLKFKIGKTILRQAEISTTMTD